MDVVDVVKMTCCDRFTSRDFMRGVHCFEWAKMKLLDVRASHFSEIEIEKGMSERARRRVENVLKSFARLLHTIQQIYYLFLRESMSNLCVGRYEKLRLSIFPGTLYTTRTLR